MYLSWIIPCYNEEPRIEKTIREVDLYLKSKNFSGGYEILVADSSSKDKTQEIVKRLQSQISNLQLLVIENKGKGWAVREGMRSAQGDIRLFSDADNATSPEHFDKMIPYFEKGDDVVISSRNPWDAVGAFQDIPESLLRRTAGKMGNLIIQIFAVPGIWDTQNGFKALRANPAEKIFSSALMHGFSFDIEMLALARKFGFTISIIPVKWKHDPESKVTLKSYIQVFADVFKIRWNLITHKYDI
ncbi:MAG: glycosyl transferase family protein [Parcubacteria group bacterium Gr01-1014_33]|nr:MAG: glycosyl transferase family protein [Parcubacteria group bacterium Gr01-1014_33]